MTQSNQAYSYLFERPRDLIEQFIHQAEKVVVGKREVIEKAFIAILCGGHILLEDVPGVGKTLLAKTLAGIVGCSFKRIQFTPDLMPGDVTGVTVFNQKSTEFEFRPGPIMTNLVLADEINRTSPRTQAALLEAMEERSVTVDGRTYPLPEPFILLATQNPLDFEGTMPLPEAQMDRFFMRLHMGYPDKRQEAAMLGNLHGKHPIGSIKPVIVSEELILLQNEVRDVHVDDSLKQYIVSLAQATREDPDILLGASPRASFALMRASQAQAWVLGRTYVIPDDIKMMLEPVLAHRLVLKPDARLAGKSVGEILQFLSENISVPQIGQTVIREDAAAASEGAAVRKKVFW
ncbi:AAA family ATPase [Ferviditalea candida]|uniref:MoxR family ATPase n=1 Tax=Ferviditalea candida TaxID=3108399 RepID=A0ABU5ZMZ7_9BACL|nr:MoxR family ATPase [Paenibacillaceae bacterium T2]